jgi:hypothetical protein
LFGLCSNFWTDDERQIYLLGLKYSTTNLWPYFGPDVVYTKSQIPGALQGLLVGLPLKLFPLPEAPFILLNLLTLAALTLLAWYCERRLPGFPRWFIWLWLFTAPWTLNYSTHVVNPSYVLPGAVLFFIGFLESVPRLRLTLVRPWMAWAMMGFGLLWVFQLHLSWPVMLPFIGASFYLTLRHHPRDMPSAMASFLLGALVAGSTLFPTFFTYGFLQGLGGTQENIVFKFEKLPDLFVTLLTRFLSLASYELPRFIGSNPASRVEFLLRHPWVIPFAVFVGIVGLAQPIVMIVEFFRSKPQPEWPLIRQLTLSTVLIIFVGFWFSVKGPASHTFYLALPVVMLYSLYCWYGYLQKQLWRRFAVAFLVAGLICDISLMIARYPRSLYKDRGLVVEAIKNNNYHLLGERRSTRWGCCY